MSTNSETETIHKQSIAMRGLFVLAILYSMYFASNILIPIFVSFILYFLFYPMVNFLHHRFQIPRYFGSALVMVLFIIVLGGGSYALSVEADSWVDEINSILKVFGQKLEKVTSVTDNLRDTFNVSVIQIQKDWFGIIFSSTWQFLIALGMMLVFLYFLLVSGNYFLKKVVALFVAPQNKKNGLNIVRQIEGELSKYLVVRSVLNIVIAIVTSILFLILQLPNPFFWGILTGIFEFIPFIGAFIMLILITLVSIVSYESLYIVALVPFIFFIYISIVGNVITPYYMGKSFAMDQVAIVLSIFFLGWIWGIVGAFIAIPLLMAIKIIANNIQQDTIIDDLLEE